MNAREEAALAALLQSKKYGEICPEKVRAVFAEQLARRKNLREAEKAARAQLHQIAGAFLTEAQIKTALSCLDAFLAGDAGALRAALSQHASTRERLETADEIYDRAFAVCGRPGLILDLACGLNPLFLGARGLRARGIDLHGGAVRAVNAWAAACGWDVRAALGDVMRDDMPAADLTLAMKLLPVVEAQGRGAGAALLFRIPSRWALITFPTRTLSGRGVGMRAHYAAWFAQIMPACFAARAEFAAPGELCYLIERTEPCQSYTSSPPPSAT